MEWLKSGKAVQSVKDKTPEGIVTIAVLGNRGIPPRYGGFDSVAWCLARYLPNHGIRLYVFSESTYRKRKPSGLSSVRIVYLPVLEKFRIVSEVFYDAVGLIWAGLRRDVQVVYLLGYSASPFCIIPRLLGKKVAINVDGLEWKRRKFGKSVRLALRVLERISHYSSDYLVFDNKEIQRFHESRYGTHPSFYMPHCIEEFDVSHQARNYYLVVARFEPENNIDVIIDGFQKSGSDNELWLVGSSNSHEYNRKLISMTTSPRVKFLGPIYGEKIGEIRRDCLAYIHGHEVGGTNPSLLEALSHGNAVLAINVPFNREVADKAGLYFDDAETLAKSVSLFESAPEMRVRMRQAALSNAKRFDQSSLIPQFAKAFRSMARSRKT